MLIVYILLFGITWLVLGDAASFSLIGDITFCYPDSCFGPLNAYKNSKFGDFDDKKEKKKYKTKNLFNIRWSSVSTFYDYLFYMWIYRKCFQNT